jgi:hypothetical protein
MIFVPVVYRMLRPNALSPSLYVDEANLAPSPG